MYTDHFPSRFKIPSEPVYQDSQPAVNSWDTSHQPALVDSLSRHEFIEYSTNIILIKY